MTSGTTETGQLSIPLGADMIWVALVDEEDQRDVSAAKERTTSNDVYTLIPLEEWRREQATQPTALHDIALQEEQLYEIDGGIFKAKQQNGWWELWVWQGHNGNDAGTRNGFEVDGSGKLYDRLYDVEAEELVVLMPTRFAVMDLRPIDASLMANVSGEQGSNVSRQIG